MQIQHITQSRIHRARNASLTNLITQPPPEPIEGGIFDDGFVETHGDMLKKTLALISLFQIVQHFTG